MDEATAGFDRRTILLGAGAAALTGAAPLAAADAALPAEWTAAERIPLWEGTPPSGTFAPQARTERLDPAFLTDVRMPDLHVFRPARPNGRALLVIPGGAYSFVSIRNEGVDVARTFNPRGYAVFVLTYRLPGEGWSDRADVPLQDAQRAMRVIRARAQHYGVDPGKLGVLGFSAGGHLAATLLTAYDDHVYAPRDAADRQSARPACGGLIYPVIAMAPPYTHPLSAELLLGPNPGAALIARRSPARHVTAATPPTFLAHSLDDGAVPWQNTQAFMDAMIAAKARTEAHYFEEGGHGYGIGAPDLPAAQWPTLFAAWLDRALSGR